MSTTARRVLHYVKSYIEIYGWAPSIREIGRDCGDMSTSHVQYHLLKLASLGYIKRAHGPRKIVMTVKGRIALRTVTA